VYCIVVEAEWRAWDQRRPATALLRLSDQQGDPIALLAVRGTDE
jgi:hypothetical protein